MLKIIKIGQCLTELFKDNSSMFLWTKVHWSNTVFE